MFDKPQLFSGDLRIGHKGAIVADECLELPTQWVTLDPVDHEATITGSSSNTIIGINEVKVITHVFPALDEIVVGVASCKKVRAASSKRG